MNSKFQALKAKLQDPEFQRAAKQVAIEIGTAVVVSIAIRAITHVAVEGTKSLAAKLNSANEPVIEETPTE